MSTLCGYLAGFVCLWFCFIGSFINGQSVGPTAKIMVSSASFDCNGVETFEKVGGVEVLPEDRIPLYSSSNGAITADCYNRCRSSSSCSAFWIDYDNSECFRLTHPRPSEKKMGLNFNRASAYFERMCLNGDICSKAWVAERVPGYELMGHDDIIIRSVISRKRCIELCLTDKRLPCRSADYWEFRKECRLSREDRRSQPGAFVQSLPEVDYIENTCIQPAAADRGKECEWEVTQDAEFKIYDYTTKTSTLLECQIMCESYKAFMCRSVTFDPITGVCQLSGADVSTTTTKLLRMRESTTYAQRVPCVDMSLECHGENMVAKLKSHSPFYGKMFAMPTPTPDCEVFGRGEILTTISYPLNSCGVHKEEDGSFVATLVVQQHPLIQKRGDSAFRLVCSFPEENRTLSQVFGFNSDSPRQGDISASASGIPSPILGVGTTAIINSTAKSPAVTLRILDVNGDDVTGVALGDELFLKIEIEPSSAYGLIARDLIAKSGTKEDELVLLDSRGCPEDPAIFPYLRRESLDSKSLKSRFEAFKFTNDAVVRFQVNLQFCRHECPPIKCEGDVSYGKKRREAINTENTDFVELSREIIVSSPSPNRLQTHLHGTNELYMKPMDNRGHNDSEVCGSKAVLVGCIVGFAIVQILIVFCAIICLCQKYKAKSESESSFRLPPRHSFDFRPQNVIPNSMRTLRPFRD